MNNTKSVLFLVVFVATFDTCAATIDGFFETLDTASASKYERSSYEMAPFLLTDDDLKLVEKVRPFVAQLTVQLTDKLNSTSSGVVIGFNNLNQPIILTAGSLIFHQQIQSLPQGSHISFEQSLGTIRSPLLDKAAHIIANPSWSNIEDATSKGWYGVPVIRSEIMKESMPGGPIPSYFGYYLMTGRAVDVDTNVPFLNEKYTVQDSLSTGFDKPALEQSNLKVSRLVQKNIDYSNPSNSVLVMGQMTDASGKSHIGYVMAEPQLKNQEERIVKKRKINIDSTSQFILLGDFEHGLLGAGVFDRDGALVGLITKILVNTRIGQVYGAVATDVLSIFQETLNSSYQDELTRVVQQKKKDFVSAPIRCSQFF